MNSIWEVMNQLLFLTLVTQKIGSARDYIYMSCCCFMKHPNVLNLVDRTGDEYRDTHVCTTINELVLDTINATKTPRFLHECKLHNLL